MHWPTRSLSAPSRRRRRWNSPSQFVLMGLLASPLRRPAAVVAAPDCGGGGGRYQAVACWLWRAKISLPDEHFNEKLVTVSVDDMSCTNFQVASLKSSPALRSSSATGATRPDLSFRIDLEGMSASCTGKYAGAGTSGNIVASVVSGSGPLHLHVDVSSKPLQQHKTANNSDSTSLPFPSMATLSACDPNLLVPDVQFSGSFSAKILDLFKGTISKKVTSSINEKLCYLIKKNGESVLNQGLHEAREYIGSLIPKNTNLGQIVFDKAVERPGRHLAKNVDIVTWDRDLPFAKRVLLDLNNFFSQHLDKGVILKFLRGLSTWNGTMSEDCKDCGFFFKGFNGLIGSLTRGTRSLEIPIPPKVLNFHNNHTFSIPKYGDIVLAARTLRVSGIDNFTDVALFRPEGPNGMSSSIASDVGFEVTMLIDLEVRPSQGAVFQGDTLNETFELHFNVSSVDFKSSSTWDIDREIFNKLSVGSFIYGSYTVFENNRNLLNCVIEALTSVVILNMEGRMNLDAIRVSPFVSVYEAGDDATLEQDIDDLINNVLTFFLEDYPVTATEALAGIIRTPVRDMLNHGFANLIDNTKAMPLHCVSVEIPKNSSDRPLRLDSNKAIMLFNDVVNDESAIAVVNSFIQCVDNNLETKNLMDSHFFNFSLGELNVVFHDLRVKNANSVYELELLKPEIDHYHLTNSFGYGMCPVTADAKNCSLTSISLGINLAYSKRYLGNINVHVDMKNLKLQGGSEIKFDMNYLPFLMIKDLVAYSQCLSVPITDIDYYGLNASIEMLDVKIDVSLVQNGGPRSFAYKTKDSAELAHVISSLMSKGSVLLEEALDDLSMIQLDEASRVCQTPVNPHRIHEARRSTGLAELWTILILLTFIAGNTWLFLRGFKNEEEEDLAVNDRSGEAQSDEQQQSSLMEPLFNNQDEMDEILEVETPRRKFPLASTSSLMYHPSIHPVVKFGFPAIIILAFILFFSSNLAVGASVDLLVTRASGKNLTSLINIYTFSLGTTMKEMMQAGVYFLMLLIMFCSGIWPYAKLFLMMTAWIASTRRLSLVKREQILCLLDSLGKFSLIDAYVLVLMMVGFRYNLEVEGVGALNVYVTPKYGFYSFLFATILSLLTGHSMIFLHRMTMMPSIPVYSGRYESLSKHIFDDKHGRGLVKLTKWFRRTTVFLLCVTLIFICIGSSLKSFHFKFNGLAGTALGDDKARAFSLVSIGEHIPKSVLDSSSFGIYWIQMFYFFFALVMPLVCLFSLFVLFLVPMRLKQQQRVFIVVEVANAWSAIEVFVIAIIASLLEISPFSESMVGEHCSLLNQILSGWSGGEGDDLHYCFDVKSSIDGSSAVLIIGVVLNSLLVSSLHRFAHHAIWERVEREDRPDASDGENKMVQDSVIAHTFVSRLRKRSRLGAFMFEDVSFGPHGEYEIDFENVVENEEPHTSNNFWSEWTKIVSVI